MRPLRVVFRFDGSDDDGTRQLAQVQSAHAADPNTADALASALDDYAALAALYRGELDGVGGFDAALVDEAKSLSHRIRRRPTAAERANQRGGDLVTLRDRVAAMLFQRMQRVRAAGRYVFRHHDDVAREFTSPYERTRRAARQRAKKP